MRILIKYLIYGILFFGCVITLIASVIKFGFWITLVCWIVVLFVVMGLVWGASKLFRFLISKDENDLDY